MTAENIQISYEEGIDSLPAKTEQHLTSTIRLLLDKIGCKERSLSLHFCSPATITSLNHTWRNSNQPTDLLSWLYASNEEEPGIPEEPWGELVYCLPVIERQAAGSGWELAVELLRLTVHGLVHLLGYDHESDAEEAEMLGIERKLLEQIGLAEVYPA